MKIVTPLAVAALAVSLGIVPATRAADDGKVATVGEHVITRAQLEEHVRPKLIELENQRYETLREGLDELIAEELVKQEASARKTTAAELEKQEVAAKVAEPTDDEIQKVYDANKAQLGSQTLEQIKPRIVEYLKQQGMERRRQAFVEELKKAHKTTVALRPPVIEVATAGRPERGGGAKAPVTIIEFSDYQCPFCGRAEGVVDQVMQHYGSKVRLVYRDFPLPMHPQARPASEAANCANAQGKFWEYHAKLFANQTALGEDKLKEYAKDVGLDATKFEQCLKDQPFKAAIDKDVADGEKVGVNGTPAFFINGRMLSGALPLDKFKEVIDEELTAKGVSSS
jgi:protein-disulfide isomerase